MEINSEYYQKHERKIKYLSVGLWNTIFGYLNFVFLFDILFKQSHYILVFLLSNILSISNSYICYKRFVFKTKGNYIREYLRFYLVYALSILLNFFILTVAVELLNSNPVFVQGGITILTVIFSYLGHKRFSFKYKLEGEI